MTKIKRKVAIVFCVVVLISSICVLSGCVQEEEKKYDVKVMIVCREASINAPILKKWIVDSQVNVFDIEQEYDGKQYNYEVYAYNVPNHPQFKDVWFLNDTNNAIRFTNELYFIKNNEDKVYYVCDKGNYYLNISASENSKLWNSRQLTLRIKVV